MQNQPLQDLEASEQALLPPLLLVGIEILNQRLRKILWVFLLCVAKICLFFAYVFIANDGAMGKKHHDVVSLFSWPEEETGAPRFS